MSCVGLLVFTGTADLDSSKGQGGSERRAEGFFSVTRGLDGSKDPRPLKSYLDVVCSLIHRLMEDSLHVDFCGFGERFPLPRPTGYLFQNWRSQFAHLPW